MSEKREIPDQHKVLQRTAGCTCQYGGATPIWYASVATCPVHKDAYSPAATPQWWIDGEARGWKMTDAQRREWHPHWWERLLDRMRRV